MPLPFPVFIFGFLALAGATLLVKGLRVRRRGETPRCGRCEYALTGLVGTAGSGEFSRADRCPECGAELVAGRAAVVYGERYRRRAVALVGAAMLLLGGLPLGMQIADQARRYDWYRLRPTTWVIDDLAGNNNPTRAAQELNRRYETGSITRGSAKLDRYADLALAEQARPSGPGQLQQELVSFLSRAVMKGDLSAERAKRFYQNAVQLTLVAPATAMPGANVPVTINETCRTQGGKLTVQISHLRLCWDGQTDPRRSGAGGYSRLSGVGAGGSTGTGIKAPATAGEHQLNVTVRVTVFTGSMDNGTANVLDQHDVELKATVNVRANAADATPAPRVP